MSSSAISGISGIGTAPLDLSSDAVQAASNTQATTQQASAAASFNSVQPILLVPTKPPLSQAVLAELIGQQQPSFTPDAGGIGASQKSVYNSISSIIGQHSPDLALA